jgi:trk system potassium uptake protein TrkA
MYILIVGGGRIGYNLAKILLGEGHEVLVIEKDPSRYELIVEELGSVALLGDGSRVGVLKEAGAARADLLIAATGKDEDNLAACQLARHLFNIPKTIAVVNSPQNEPLFLILGVDVTVNSTELVLSHIEAEIPGRPMVHLIALRGVNWEVVSIKIPPDGALVGKPIKDVVLPPNSFLALVIKDGGPITPTDETILEAHDEVMAVTTPEEEQLLWETLTGAA